jgi:hypothetical protein
MQQIYYEMLWSPCTPEKPGWKVLFADLLWEKNNVPWLINSSEQVIKVGHPFFFVYSTFAWELQRSIEISIVIWISPWPGYSAWHMGWAWKKGVSNFTGLSWVCRSTAHKAQHLPVACRDAQNPRRHGPIPRPHSLYKVSPRSPPSPSRPSSFRTLAAAAAACLPQPPSPWAEVSSRFRFSSFVRFYCDVCCNRLFE